MDDSMVKPVLGALNVFFDSKSVNTTIKVLNATGARDKVYRVLIYYSRFMVYRLKKANSSPDLIAIFASIQSNLSPVRKVLRLGNFISALKLALAALTRPGDQVANILTFLSRISNAVYVIVDMLAYFHSIKIIKLKDPKKALTTSNRLWGSTIFFSILHSLYVIPKINRRIRALSDEAVHVKGEIVDVEAEKELISLKAQKESITDQLTIDALEFPLPLASLGYVNLSDGTIGGIGTVTSMMMLRKIIKGF